MQPIIGVDISDNQWRRGLPFKARTAMLSQGVRWLIARASIGFHPDPAFPTTRARSGPFKMFGAYHYLVDSLDPAGQAETFMNVLHDTGTVKGCAAALDVEDDHTGPIHNVVSLSSVERWVKRWRDLHPQHPLIAYSNRATWFRLGNPDLQSLGFDTAWQALYVTPNPPPFPARAPLAFGSIGRAPLWQHGPFRLRYSGRMLSIDGDAFYGTEAELVALAGDTLLPPIADRPRYKNGFNALIGAAERSVTGLQVPDPGSGPAWEAGVEDARQAALDSLNDLLIGR